MKLQIHVKLLQFCCRAFGPRSTRLVHPRLSRVPPTARTSSRSQRTLFVSPAAPRAQQLQRQLPRYLLCHLPFPVARGWHRHQRRWSSSRTAVGPRGTRRARHSATACSSSCASSRHRLAPALPLPPLTARRRRARVQRRPNPQDLKTAVDEFVDYIQYLQTHLTGISLSSQEYSIIILNREFHTKKLHVQNISRNVYSTQAYMCNYVITVLMSLQDR